MTAIIIKTLFGLFIWLVLGQILCGHFKLKKNVKMLVNVACKIIGIAIMVFAGIDLVKFLLNFLQL